MANKNARCPVCEERFEIEPDLEVGDITSCPGCYADLKILNLHPVDVQEADGVSASDDDDEGDADAIQDDDDSGDLR